MAANLSAPSELNAALPDFPADAHLRVMFAAQPIPAPIVNALLTALSKLFQQFVREGRCHAYACTAACADQVLLLAWSPGEPLSGCSHDKINQVLATYERAHPELNLLSPPPILLETADGFVAMTRNELRACLSAGTATAASRAVDATLTSVGTWRERGVVALAQHPLGQRLGLGSR